MMRSLPPPYGCWNAAPQCDGVQGLAWRATRLLNHIQNHNVITPYASESLRCVIRG
jgi:hypothetical protein